MSTSIRLSVLVRAETYPFVSVLLALEDKKAKLLGKKEEKVCDLTHNRIHLRMHFD